MSTRHKFLAKNSTNLLVAGALLGGVVMIPYYWIFSQVDIYVDNKVIKMRSLDRKVQDILEKAKINYGPLDIIQPEVWMKLTPGENIKIIRVKEEIRTEVVSIPDTTVSRDSYFSNLRPIEIHNGYTGQKQIKLKIRYHDGREFSKEILTEKINKIEKRQLILKNKKQETVRVYDLTKTPYLWVTATSYYPGDPMCYPGDGQTTYLGLKLRRGFVAVDPKVIPLRSRLYIPGYGYAYAADTGGAIKGKRIDICLNTKKESDRFGRRRRKVYILEKASTW